MQTLDDMIREDGLALSMILSFLDHHNCRRIASVNRTFKNILNNEHSIWRLFTLRTIGMEGDEAIPMKGLDWYAASSLVSSKLRERKVYKDLGPLHEDLENYSSPLIGNNGTMIPKRDCRNSSHVTEVPSHTAREDVAIDGVRRLSSQLLTLFDNLISHQSAQPAVYCRGTMEKMPDIFLPSLDENLKIPVDPSVLRRLIDEGHCEQAPLGRGTETIIDLDTRRCWRMDLGNKAMILGLEEFIGQTSMTPETILYEVKEKLAPNLGFHGEIVAQPYQLLIYEEGGMFKPHRDTLRGKNNIGSLVMTLPVHGGTEGGNLVLTHESITSKDSCKAEIGSQ